MAVTCVSIVPAGNAIGVAGPTIVRASSVTSLIAVDPTCSSGMVILSQDDLKLRIEPEGISDARTADMYSLFLALLGVLVAVWGVKQLLRIFTDDRD